MSGPRSETIRETRTRGNPECNGSNMLERDGRILFTAILKITPNVVPVNNTGVKMPRNYIRTETKYKLEDLQKGVEDVKTKRLTIGKAAETYSVPKTTIFDHLKKAVIKQPRTGRKPLFTDEQELELVDYIIKCSKLYYGLTIRRIRRIAFQLAERNNLPHKFDRVKQLAGKDWYYNFMKRHPITEVHSTKTFDIQASDTRAIHLQSGEEQSVSLSEIVELPIIPPKTSKRNIRKRKSIILTSTPVKNQLEEKKNRKLAKEEEIKKKSQKTQKKEMNTKRPKRNNMNKETKRVLKNFSNIKEEREKKEEKENVDYYCIFCKNKYVSPPNEDWIMCYVCEYWAHEKCTHRQSTSAGYKCDLCRN
ncbi:hypothetical protein ILUMI_25761 [Ignelater luminosus]|uniref:HTH CENPB-type domain-containing protein n=1 Tax=Ignelater luminosus TaxID=2038154 RepID=A0A8K0C7U7_IGNLU|nr:hypothetical protein ILUMI_25761 [Ignelater luminosus]